MCCWPCGVAGPAISVSCELQELANIKHVRYSVTETYWWPGDKIFLKQATRNSVLNSKPCFAKYLVTHEIVSSFTYTVCICIIYCILLFQL